jgi:O-acetyl-ADP-ribose deacetylase (regulator of RNase III)
MNQLTIKNTTVEIYVGELIQTEHDALVLNANSRLLPSGELRCKILREAGSTVQVECNSIIQKVSIISPGEAVMTSGGNLGSRYLIHTRAGHDGKKLMLATWNSLKLADEFKLETITFPPMLKDVIGFSAKKSADVMLPTIHKFLKEKNKHLKKVFICLETLPDYKDFENVLDNLAD